MKKVVFALALLLTPTLVFAHPGSTPRSASQEDLSQYSESKSSPRLKRFSANCAKETEKAYASSKKPFMASLKANFLSVVHRILTAIGV